jgi:hypothetical protein
MREEGKMKTNIELNAELWNKSYLIFISNSKPGSQKCFGGRR